jgi:hypothetical protein
MSSPADRWQQLLDELDEDLDARERELDREDRLAEYWPAREEAAWAGATVAEIAVQTKGEPAAALVDPEDYERFGGLRWYLTSGYAARRAHGATVYLHRLILGLVPGDGLQCDHINRDRLDNRRVNLRTVPQARNLRNRGSKPGSSSRFRGVWFRADRGTWGAQAKLEEQAHCLGTFKNEIDAAIAVNEFWIAHGYEAPNQVDLSPRGHGDQS